MRVRRLRLAILAATLGLGVILASLTTLPLGLSGSFAALRPRLEFPPISRFLGQRTGLAPAPVAAMPLEAPLTLLVTGVTFTVNTTNDVDDTVCNAAHCSLREAINAANATPATRDLIVFSIPGAPADVPAGSTTARHQITVLTALPTITDPVIIDGSTEPDFAGNPVVAINGNGLTANGLHITAGTSSVQYLEIYDFDGDGIRLETSGGNVILQNYIGTDYNLVGTDVVSNFALFNTGDGLRISGIVTTTVAGNTIASNSGSGVRIDGAGASVNLVQGNFIGAAQKDGTRPGNGGSGILVTGAPTNTLTGNFIHGNGGHGIEVTGAGATGNGLVGNVIGSSFPAAGGFGGDLPNALDGIHIQDSPNNDLLQNAIGANGGDGVEISGATATGNALYGNQIGTSTVLGGQDLGNGGDGVRIDGASDTCVGGDSSYALCPGSPILASSGNTIAFNSGNGVNVVAGTGNAIRFNSIYSNGGLGIDLGDDGATPNDAGDGDLFVIDTGNHRGQRFGRPE
jgi:CSLREA domain-containing protein